MCLTPGTSVLWLCGGGGRAEPGRGGGAAVPLCDRWDPATLKLYPVCENDNMGVTEKDFVKVVGEYRPGLRIAFMLRAQSSKKRREQMQGGTASAALPRCECCLWLRRAYVTKGILFTMSSCLIQFSAHRVPSGYWKQLNNRVEFFNSIRSQLGVTEVTVKPV